MLIKLALNNKGVKQYNQYVRDFNKEEPDFSLEEVEKLEDRFCPYPQMMRDPAWEKYKPVAKDTRPNVELHGVYVCQDVNDEYALEMLTDYKTIINCNSPIYWWDYGVADNASQILDYYEHLVAEHGDYMNERKFIVLMTSVFREDQPEDGGWRWNKWGMYIGDFEQKHEYLYDEQGIDYVWVFKILEVERCDGGGNLNDGPKNT